MPSIATGADMTLSHAELAQIAEALERIAALQTVKPTGPPNIAWGRWMGAEIAREALALIRRAQASPSAAQFTRATGQNAEGGWKLPVPMLQRVQHLARKASGYSGATLEEVEAILLEAERCLSPSADGWEPIETAPMNFDVVLLYQPSKPGFAKGVGQGHRTDLREYAHNKWVFQATGMIAEPTHWRPLPAPPIPQEPGP
jgi:hypothetical protein